MCSCGVVFILVMRYLDSNHTGNPVVLFNPLISDQTICVGVIQTIHQDSNHTPNPAGFIQTIFVCLKPLAGLTQTIPTKILYHSAIPPDKARQHRTSPYIPTCRILHHRFSTGSIPQRTLYCIQTGNCGTFLLVVMHPTYFT